MGGVTVRFLNSRERKHFFATLQEDYGYKGTQDYVLMTPGNGKYYLLSRDVEKIDYEQLRIKQGGLYVACDAKEGIRLSMDGAIHFGPDCEHQPVMLDMNGRDEWMRGNDVAAGEHQGWVIVSHEKDILGCGRVRDGRVINYVPKERRIASPH